MPASDDDSNSSQPSSQVPDHAQVCTNGLDTEMTSPLTSNDDDSSCPSSPTDTMSRVRPGREGSESLPNHRHRNSRNRAPPNHSHAGWQQDNNSGYPGSALVTFSPTPFGSTPPGGLYTGPRDRVNSTLTGQDRVPLSAVSPGPVWPTESQLNTAYGYGVQRYDGSFTRLIRADQLGGHYGNVPEYQGPEGLIIVPEPRQPSPSRRQGPMPLVPGDVVDSLPINRPHRPQNGPRYDLDETQNHIDSIIAQSASMSPSPRQFRREKIYCDKWIHEGVCAFTQMGCKYKHEMPMDKATQMSLGLNHGIPNWYRRAYSVQLHSPSPPAAPLAISSNPNRLSGNWRRTEDASFNSGSPSIASVMQSSPPGTRNSYGPIGPPPPHPQSSFYNNPYSDLEAEDHENGDGEEDDTITWRGRRH